MRGQHCAVAFIVSQDFPDAALYIVPQAELFQKLPKEVGLHVEFEAKEICYAFTAAALASDKPDMEL